jgi:hypothetical protein
MVGWGRTHAPNELTDFDAALMHAGTRTLAPMHIRARGGNRVPP